MRLTKFKVTNFRSVADSGWIETERVTALIGINESGKSNLLLPLWKLNPAGTAGKIDRISDPPKDNYTAIRKNPEKFEFITACFDTTDIANQLSGLSGTAQELLNEVEVKRYFDGHTVLTFPKYRPPEDQAAPPVSKTLEDAKNEIEKTTPIEQEIGLKATLIAALNSAAASISNKQKLSKGELETLVAGLSQYSESQAAEPSAIISRFKTTLKSIQPLIQRLSVTAPDTIDHVRKHVLERMPRFVYYSNYGNLDSEIYLPHVIENLRRTDLGPSQQAKTRTLRVLFNFVGLEPSAILELGKDFPAQQNRKPTDEEIGAIATKKKDRTNLLNSAGTELTKKFREWWKQGNYIFEFQADGDHFRIWVSDELRPEKVELESRSAGLQWFFSFYLVFLVEQTGEHKNAILLLDEPGLSLHPLAQRVLSKFFDGLAETNQIIYTAHSPFMVDADMLDRARKVYVDANGSTKCSSDLRAGNEDDPRKLGAIYAVFSALNMNIGESFLLGCQPVIVEGFSDQVYLTAIKSILIGTKRISPKREIVFPPCHGAKNARTVASIITGRDESLPMILFDGDQEGKKMAEDLKNHAYKSTKGRIHLTDEYLDFSDSEIEDLFPRKFMADIVDRWQRNSNTLFRDFVKKGPIVPQITGWAAQEKMDLDKGWKVDLARRVKKRTLEVGAGGFDQATLDRWTKMFGDLIDQ